jgi:hypothetical protein
MKLGTPVWVQLRERIQYLHYEPEDLPALGVLFCSVACLSAGCHVLPTLSDCFAARGRMARPLPITCLL